MLAKLAIYIPTFNRKESLRDCINSISKQIGNDVVVYVSNNCSDDGTKDYLDSLSYSWLYVENKEENIGGAYNQVGAWYIPLDVEYVWMIGDDDYLMPGAIKTVLSVIENEDVDFIFCNTQAHPKSKEKEVMSLWNAGEVVPGAVKGKFTKSFKCNFSELIDPKVADSLMLEIMCLCVRKSSISSAIPFLTEESDKFEECGRFYTACTDPLLKSFSETTPSFYIHQPLTFNFWGGGNGWAYNYDYVFPIAILYMIESYYKHGFVSIEKYKDLLGYYFSLMAGSLERQIEQTSTAKKFSDDIWKHIELAHRDNGHT